MRIREPLIVLVTLAGTHVAFGQSICSPCVDPVSSPIRTDFESTTETVTITAEDMQRLGLVSAADMLSQLPSNTRPPSYPGFTVGWTLACRRGLIPECRPSAALPPAKAGAPLVHETVIAAPVDNVWRAWSTSTGLSAWLAPLATIELRIGGKLAVSYDGSGVATATAIENEILAFDPRRMLSFRVTNAPQDFAFAAAAAAMWTVVYLEPAGEAATRVRVVVNGLPEDENEARAFFDSGNAQTLQRLAQRFDAAD